MAPPAHEPGRAHRRPGPDRLPARRGRHRQDRLVDEARRARRRPRNRCSRATASRTAPISSTALHPDPARLATARGGRGRPLGPHRSSTRNSGCSRSPQRSERLRTWRGCCRSSPNRPRRSAFARSRPHELAAEIRRAYGPGSRACPAAVRWCSRSRTCTGRTAHRGTRRGPPRARRRDAAAAPATVRIDPGSEGWSFRVRVLAGTRTAPSTFACSRLSEEASRLLLGGSPARSCAERPRPHPGGRRGEPAATSRSC